MSQEEKRYKVLVALLLVLLAANWLTWMRVGKMQSEINSLQGNMNNLSSRVSSDVTGISGVVNQMKDDARWWTPAEVEFLEVNKDQARVKLSWSLREYSEGSKVMLNYQKPGEQKYTQLAPEQEAPGRFAVVIPVAVTQEPIINLQVQKSGNNADSKSAMAVQQTVDSNGTGPELNYYISMQDGAAIRTSEKQSLPLEKLSYSMFSPINLDVSLLEAGKIVASAHTYLTDKTQYAIKEITLESRDGNAVVEKWPLERVNNQGQGVYQLNTTSAIAINSLYLVINYEDGMQAERKII